MSIYNHYSPVKEYRVREPEVSISYRGVLPSTDTYLEDLDREMGPSGAFMLYSGSSDLLSRVFRNQAAAHAADSRQLATLILERGRFAGMHLWNIEWRMGEVQEKRPELVHKGARPGGYLLRIDQQMAELDKQKRDVELGLWQNPLELRRDLHEDRREYIGTQGPMSYIPGSSYENR